MARIIDQHKDEYKIKLFVVYRYPEKKFVSRIIEITEPCIITIINRLIDAFDKKNNYNDYAENFIWEKEILRSYLVGFLNKTFYDICQVGIIFEPGRDPNYMSEQYILVDYVNDKRYKIKKERKKKNDC